MSDLVLNQLASQLRTSTHTAQHWYLLNPTTKRVQCTLSPRECKIPNGGLGFCGVRYNDNGELRTLNYGKSVEITQETIETEGVFHAYPGNRILSLGNIGCMMHCDFCQNWSTSQARLVADSSIHQYTPEQIVKTALDHNINIISWTYNDPVVWQEFILETAKLAQQAGLKNLYKSALYINPKPLEELFDVIDIFSISLKSMNDRFYQKYTKAHLKPVLDGIEAIYKAGKHLEVSNLVVTGRNDYLEETDKVAHWVKEYLSPEVPLHYVRFQPSYRYTQVKETSKVFLEQARQSALNIGIKHVYLGNLEETPYSHSYCQCGFTLVERYGLNTKVHININGHCPQCGIKAPILLSQQKHTTIHIPNDYEEQIIPWTDSVATVRLEINSNDIFYYQFINKQQQASSPIHDIGIRRHVVSRFGKDNWGLRVWIAPTNQLTVTPIIARAHYPTET